MKKVIIICIVFVVILLIAIIGSILVSPKDKIEEKRDILETQKEVDNNYVCYGYTIDNPRIVINPFDNSLLSALIMFETDNAQKVSVYLYDNNNKYLLYEETEETRCHYLDVYNLVSGDNKVVLETNGKEYTYNIKTEKIKVELPQVDVSNNDIYFTNIDSSLVGINSKKQVVYYLEGFTNKVIQLENGHLLTTVNRVNNDGSYISFAEIDMLGRIYNEYVLEDGYYNLVYPLENGNYLALSKDILEIDRQNGKVVKRFSLDEEDEWVNLSYDNDKIILSGLNKTVYINYNNSNQEVILKESRKIDNKIQIIYGNYYKKFNQNRFGNNKETSTSDIGVNMLFYKSKDKLYEEYKISFVKEYDRIVINKNKDEDIYIILDKFGKRLVYKMENNVLNINTVNLSGRYNIYVKIDNKVYKSDYYVDI